MQKSSLNWKYVPLTYQVHVAFLWGLYYESGLLWMDVFFEVRFSELVDLYGRETQGTEWIEISRWLTRAILFLKLLFVVLEIFFLHILWQISMKHHKFGEYVGHFLEPP